MPGPLPDEGAIRRNAPTIPTTTLPLSGRKGDPPDVPSWTHLGTAGLAWWNWAWHTPQAVAWGTSVGMESMVARRASLEDDLAAMDSVEGLDWSSVIEAENMREVREAIGRVAALATGRLQLMKHMTDLDDKLGLTPKGQAALRWKVVDDTPADLSAPPATGGNVTGIDSRRARLTDAS